MRSPHEQFARKTPEKGTPLFFRGFWCTVHLAGCWQMSLIVSKRDKYQA